MGYSHYFTLKSPVPDELWDQVLDAVNDIENATNIPLDDGHEYDVDGFTSERTIHLNGVGDDAHETLYIEPTEPGWSFCKTANKPYDTVVVAVLCAIDQICGAYFTFESDGDSADWLSGRALAEYALKRTVNVPASI